MKALIITLFVLVQTLNGYSQNIVELFESLPDSSIMGLTNAQRKSITQYSIDKLSGNFIPEELRKRGILYSFEVLDIKNGYIKLVGAFQGHLQICYWNLSNGNKFIAIYGETCGPVCYIMQFDFYEYDGKFFKPIKRKNVIPDIYDDFFSGDVKTQIEEMKKKDLLATLLFELPKKGKNIIAKWGNEDGQEAYKKYGRGDRMVLIWSDGNFKKGNIYWNE